ncbi:B-(1-6) glucan synthase [Apodospora peruviana]|uniref:B-(1-6) glucan synthase n=1 Tax=Apodospora peruviana TaxID=516989 RepID=A0AAE0M1B2_9PEZI|nr:B-(1-6) glucan synthase [Apodospora peruviana]
MRSVISTLVLAALAAATPKPHCFPYGTATLPKDLSKPHVPLKDWWCPQSMAYGFQGFSYPMEYYDCSAPQNGFEYMRDDFARMKRDFGASIVRMYYPVCTNESVFENAIRAGVANDMAVIFQVWTNFGDGNEEWQQSQQAIYNVLSSETFGPLAPYVVHSADFGSEPVGDGMDGGGDQFLTDLGQFRAVMNAHGIHAGISEDWDRPGIMSGDHGVGLGPIGARVRANSDHCHAHIMPYYLSSNPTVAQAWPYIRQQIAWLARNVQLPTMITETQWAWAPHPYHGGATDVGLAQYTEYWKKFDEECKFFKLNNVGWFLHTWLGEATFDMVYDNGSYVIPHWRPRKC